MESLVEKESESHARETSRAGELVKAKERVKWLEDEFEAQKTEAETRAEQHSEHMAALRTRELESSKRATDLNEQVVLLEGQLEEAQAKALEAETARVKAEQARDVGDEYQVKGHGSALRSDILRQRSDTHGENADKADAQAYCSAHECQLRRSRQNHTRVSSLREFLTHVWWT